MNVPCILPTNSCAFQLKNFKSVSKSALKSKMVSHASVTAKRMPHKAWVWVWVTVTLVETTLKMVTKLKAMAAALDMVRSYLFSTSTHYMSLTGACICKKGAGHWQNGQWISAANGLAVQYAALAVPALAGVAAGMMAL
jgi:hypothetical protein